MPLKPSPETTNYLQSRIGMALSVLCAIHCVATPILFLVAPALASQAEGLDWLEWAAFLLASSMLIWQIWPEYLIHRNPTAVVLSLIGLALVSVGLVVTFFPNLQDFHWLASGIGSLFIASAFYKAHRLRHHPKGHMIA